MGIPFHFVIIVLVALIVVLLAVRARQSGHLPPAVAWAVIGLGVLATILLFVWPILPFVDRGLDEGVPFEDNRAPVRPANPPGAAQQAETTGSNRSATPALTNYVRAASAMDLFEVQAGGLARRRGQSSAVRELGERFAIEHRASSDQMARAAGAAGVAMPAPALTPGQSALLRRIERASNDDFDQVWLAAQVEAHKAALALHTQAAQSLPPGQMAALAKAMAQKVNTHMQHAQSVSRSDGTR